MTLPADGDHLLCTTHGLARCMHPPTTLGGAQLQYWTEGDGREHGLKEGEVLVSNHPQLAGGSHLPDITVITPVFNHGRIVFFVASRGHHQDVGGTTPGSMPPNSQSLAEEGAAILAFKLVENGKFQVCLGEPLVALLCRAQVAELDEGRRSSPG